MTKADTRTLDERIAEDVMGLVPCGHWTHVMQGVAGTWWERTATCPHEPGTCYAHRGLETQSAYGYSTVLNYAFEVVERMRSLGWYLRLSQEVDGWQAFFGYEGETGYGAWQRATAPLAICEAALVTLEQEGPE